MSYCRGHFALSENIVGFVFSHKREKSCVTDKMGTFLEIIICFHALEESIEKWIEAQLEIEVPYIFCRCEVWTFFWYNSQLLHEQ